MLDLPVSVACSRLDEIVDDVRAKHEHVFLTRRGRRVAAVIDAGDLERLTRRRRTWRTLKPPTPPVLRSLSTAPSPGTRSRLTEGWRK